METDWLKRVVLAVLLTVLLALMSPMAQAAGNTTQDGQALLPGSESWQPYLDDTLIGIKDFVQDPLDAVRKILPGDMAKTVRDSVGGYAQVLLFLLLVMLVFFFAGETKADLLDLAAAGGTALLCWTSLAGLAETVCTKLENWRVFLLGFIPIYQGVLVLGGETTAAAATGGRSSLALMPQPPRSAADAKSPADARSHPGFQALFFMLCSLPIQFSYYKVYRLLPPW